MKSPVVKRSIILAGHKTSVSLEDEFWAGLKEIAGKRLMSLSTLVDTIDAQRQQGSIFRRRFGFLCSITIAPGYATWKPAMAFMKCCLIPRVCTPEPLNWGRSGGSIRAALIHSTSSNFAHAFQASQLF